MAKKKMIGLSLDEEQVVHLRKLSHQRSIKEEKEINYMQLIREAVEQVYFSDKIKNKE
jgi:hypothetical protein